MNQPGIKPFGAPPVALARVASVEDAAQAYTRREAEIVALPPDQVGRITTDVAHAVSIALGAVKNLESLRPELKKLAAASPHAMAALDGLKDYALALLYTHVRCMPARTQAELQACLEEARPLREKLLQAAEVAATFELVDGVIVGQIRTGTGHLDAGYDLIALATLYRANWAALEHNVPVTLAMVERAAALGPELLAMAGERTVGTLASGVALDWPALRARAFRLLINAYEELRHCVAFIRRNEGDAGAFAPSLHDHGGGRPARDPEDELPAADPASAAAPGAAAPGAPGAVAPVPGGPVPIGHLGSEPFVT